MSAGLAGESDLPLDLEMLEWADRVFVMEARHRKVIERKFATANRRAPIVVLGIRDEFQLMDDNLVAILRDRMSAFLP